MPLPLLNLLPSQTDQMYGMVEVPMGVPIMPFSIDESYVETILSFAPYSREIQEDGRWLFTRRNTPPAYTSLREIRMNQPAVIRWQ